MSNFVEEIWEKVLFGYSYLNSYRLSVVFKPNKVLKRQNILPGYSKNSTMDRQSQLILCGHVPTLPTVPVYLIYLSYLTYLTYLTYLFCTATCGIFIEPQPDTQRNESRGERGIWVAVSCYLLHVSPLQLPPSPHRSSVAPPVATLSGLAGRGRPLPLPLSHTPPPPYRIIADLGSLGQKRGRPLFRSL
jgi:hypothetical protein